MQTLKDIMHLSEYQHYWLVSEMKWSFEQCAVCNSLLIVCFWTVEKHRLPDDMAVSWHTCMVNMLTCSLCPHLDTHEMYTWFPNDSQVFIVWWVKQCNSNTIGFLLRRFESHILLMCVSLYFSFLPICVYISAVLYGCMYWLFLTSKDDFNVLFYLQTNTTMKPWWAPPPSWKKEWTEVNSSFFLNKTSAGRHLP